MLVTLSPSEFRSLEWIADRYPSGEYLAARFVDDDDALDAWRDAGFPDPCPPAIAHTLDTTDSDWDAGEYRRALYDDNGDAAQSVPVCAGGTLAAKLAPLADLDLDPMVSELDAYADRGPVWARWFGGANYSHPYPDDPAPRFATVADAVAEHDNAYRGHGFTGEGDAYSGDTPCVGLDCSTWLYFTDSRELADPYPDLIVEHDGRAIDPFPGDAGWRVTPA